MDQRQPLKQSIFHCQSIGDAHEVSSSRIRRVGERKVPVHGQLTDKLRSYPAARYAVCRRCPLHGSVLDNRAEVSHQTTRQRARQMRSAAQLQSSRRFTASCRISSASVGIYCGRLTTGLLRARAFVERDAVTTALIRA